LHVLERRFPLIDVEIVPSPVQGATAAAALVHALRWAASSGRYDALLITRGGGSLEDLWCFNDESLVRAIVASAVPVMSAVGHEIDTTLADLAADIRAPTPSAAAELLVPDRMELLAGLSRQRARLQEAMRRLMDAKAQRADRASLRLQVVRPHARLERGAARLQQLRDRLLALPQRSLLRIRERLDSLAQHLRILHPGRSLEFRREQLIRARFALHRGMKERLRQDRLRAEGVARAMEAVSPLATLQRGFAILRDDGGVVVRSVAQTGPGQRLIAKLVDGDVALRVEKAALPFGEG
jgi:exodeoxyribonuclease VII large subunit